MKRLNHVKAMLVLAAGMCAGQAVTEITLPATRIFPESITSTADGTLIVGSLGAWERAADRAGKEHS